MDLTQYNSSPEALPDEGGTGKLPEGKYGAECVGFEPGQWPSGDKFVEFKFVISGPTHKGWRIEYRHFAALRQLMAEYGVSLDQIWQ